MAVQQIQQY